jgi:rRNA-processing protein FCF1
LLGLQFHMTIKVSAHTLVGRQYGLERRRQQEHASKEACIVGTARAKGDFLATEDRAMAQSAREAAVVRVGNAPTQALGSW